MHATPDPRDRLLTVVTDLSFARDLDDITRVVRGAARALTGADGVTFVIRDGDECFYVDEDAIAPLWKGSRFPLSGCVSGWAMVNESAVVIPDIRTDPRIPQDVYASTFVRSMAMVPVGREEPVAAIGAYWAVPDAPTTEALATLEALAQAASLAFRNVSLLQDLQHALDRERSARAEAELANRLRDTFLGTLARELRTPQSVVQGWLWQLEQGGASPDVVGRAASAIARNTAQQARLVDDLLDASRALAGTLELFAGPVDVAHICTLVLEDTRAAARTKGIAVSCESAPLPCLVEGDPARLRQAIRALVDNALKFTSTGGRVTVSTSCSHGHVRIAVRDTGVGISADLLPKVFDLMRQAEPLAGQRTGGLGLGLAIARSVVALHRGILEAESEGPGRGSTFTVALPLAATIDAAPRLDGLCVLVVDATQPAAVAQLLEEQGARVIVAPSTADAVKAIDASEPDVLVADLPAAGFDGYDMLRKVRATTGRRRRIPAAAIATLATTEEQRKARDAGYEAYIPAPVSAATLAATLRALVPGEVR